VVILFFAVTNSIHGGNISNAGEYNQALGEAQKISQEALDKLSRDEPLTSQDRSNLSKADDLFISIIKYQPDLFAPWLARGMIYRGLNDPTYAEQMFQMCLRTIPPSKNPDVIATSAEAHYQLSRVYFDQHKYDNAIAEASTAIQTVANNPNYLTARAAAFMQKQRYDEAKKDLDDALKLMPDHKRAASLRRLLH